MKRTFCLSIAMVGALAGVATAEAPNPLATPDARPQATYKMTSELPVFENHVAHAVPGFSNRIYLNNCKPGGCSVRPGNDNSLANPPTSIVPEQNSIVQPYEGSDAQWQAIVACVRKSYAPFAVEIVTERPTTGDYHMAIVAGDPADVQMPSGVGGVSPFTCGYIPNAVSFSFANVYNGDIDEICWTVAQETAHSWGLDHKFDNRDPMTYLQSGPSVKVFQNQAGACGEFSARACQCGGSTMNSFAEILETFGAGVPTPPMVGISSPKDGDTVAAGFPVRADITDDTGINKAELRIDGLLVASLESGPFAWNAPMTLGKGRHKLKVIGYDIANTSAELEISVTLGAACKKASDCDRDTDVCVDGRCVAGSGVDGGLGDTCTTNTECASQQCGADATGERHCVEQCEPSSDGCPSGFTCLDSGGGNGVCWPGDDGGTCSSGTPASSLLFFGVAALLVLRRRRR